MYIYIYYEAGVWWDQSRSFCHYLRAQYGCYFHVSVTNLSCGGIRFNFCFLLCLDYESSVWWAQVRLLAGKELSKLGEDERVVLVPSSFLLFLFRLRSWRVVGSVQSCLFRCNKILYWKGERCGHIFFDMTRFLCWDEEAFRLVFFATTRILCWQGERLFFNIRRMRCWTVQSCLFR